MKSTPIIGYTLALFTVMMWSMNLIYAKYLADKLTPEEISFSRWSIASLAMLPFILKELINKFQLVLKSWKLIVSMALSGIGGLNLLVYYAGRTASATNMSLLSILGPIFLIVLSHQQISFKQKAGVLITVFGAITIILNGNFNELSTFQFVIGDVYMLGSAFLFAVYALIQKNAPTNISPLLLLFAASFVSTLIFMPAAMPALKTIRLLPTNVWYVLIILGIINSFLAYLCWDKALQKIGAITAGALYYTMPAFTMFFSYLFLNDKPDAAKMFGLFVVCIGVLMLIKPTLKNKTK